MKQKMTSIAVIAVILTVAITLPSDIFAEEEFSGTFSGADWIHSAEGNAKVLLLEDESQTLRLENFKVTNGPDLYIYLATDNNASDFINLGKLKASNGNQNYEIPQGK